MVEINTEVTPQVVTVKEEDQVKERARPRYRVRVFRNWCKGCGLCIAFCPKQVFVMGDEHAQPVNQERCVGCMWCTMHCPDFAIVVQAVEDGGEAVK